MLSSASVKVLQATIELKKLKYVNCHFSVVNRECTLAGIRAHCAK